MVEFIKNKIIKNKFLRGIAVVITLGLVYFYPVQRYLAIRNVGEYMKLQGTSMDNVLFMEAYKNYEQDGYYVDVVFKDNPEFIYSYVFKAGSLNTIFSYKSVFCLIYEHNYESTKLLEKVENAKYMPLKRRFQFDKSLFNKDIPMLI